MPRLHPNSYGLVTVNAPAGVIHFIGNVSPIERARSIARTLGTFKAARYLKNRGWSLEAALHILGTRPARRTH